MLIYNNIYRTNVHVIGISEKEEKDSRKSLEGIEADICPNLMKTIIAYIQLAQQTLTNINIFLRHIIIKLLNANEKSQKQPEEKRQVHTEEQNIPATCWAQWMGLSLLHLDWPWASPRVCWLQLHFTHD